MVTLKMPKFCHQCGEGLGERKRFCGNCGEPVKYQDQNQIGKGLVVQRAEIIPPSPTIIERPNRLYDVSGGTIHHNQEFRDKTGGVDTFFQSFGSSLGSCFGQTAGCIVIPILILFGLLYLLI